jgi:hypothetical protein
VIPSDLAHTAQTYLNRLCVKLPGRHVGSAGNHAATSQDPEMAGALSPLPLFEDGDLDIPSVYMTDKDGSQLAACIGANVSL